MRRIPFDIKYRPEIEAGKYKVVTEHGESVRIICWDSKFWGAYPVIALISDGDGEDIIHISESGNSNNNSVRGEQLYVITDEPEELTEFEKAVEAIYESCGVKELQLRKKASELLVIAQKEIEKSQWIKDIREWCYNKGHLEGYAKGQEDAEKRHNEATSFHYNLYPLVFPSCYGGGPCTNPHRDCINCPRTGTSGIAKTDTNIK